MEYYLLCRYAPSGAMIQTDDSTLLAEKTRNVHQIRMRYSNVGYIAWNMNRLIGLRTTQNKWVDKCYVGCTLIPGKRGKQKID